MTGPLHVDVRSLRPAEGEPGLLVVTLAGGRQYATVRVRPCFPLSDPGRCIAFLDAADGHRLIGILDGPDALTAESRHVLQAALERRAFKPEIERILHLREKKGVGTFHVLTSHGETWFTVQNLWENMSETNEGVILITDSFGIRYRIGCRTALDRTSRCLLARFI